MSYRLTTERAAKALGISEEAVQRLEVAMNMADKSEKHLLLKPDRPTAQFSRRGRPRVVGVDREPNGRIRRKTKSADKRAGEWSVYFIGNAEFNKVKIGFAVDVNQRIKEIAVGCPLDVEVWKTVGCISERDARNVERWFHIKLKARGHHARGEWFNLSLGQAESLVGEFWSEMFSYACVQKERQL
jgi:hypothetical protein